MVSARADVTATWTKRRTVAAILPEAVTPSAHFSKFVLHRSAHLHELRKVMGTSKLVDSSTAYRSEVPERNSPLVMQGLQIGGTSMNRLIQRRGWPDNMDRGFMNWENVHGFDGPSAPNAVATVFW
jgi:hypothetical protein